MGIQCALCHSTVDDSFAPGIGKRLDGWADRDLNVGVIVSLAPNLKPFSDLLGVDVATVKKVLDELGPRPLRRRARQGRQGLPAGREAGGHAHSAGFRSRRREPPHLDGLRARSRTGTPTSRRPRCTARGPSSTPGSTTRSSSRSPRRAAPGTRAASRTSSPRSSPRFTSTSSRSPRRSRRRVPSTGTRPRAAKQVFNGKAKCATLPRAAALHRARQQPARAERDRRRLLPGRPVADAHVPHRAARRTVEPPEGRLLPRRPVRERCGTSSTTTTGFSG